MVTTENSSTPRTNRAPRLRYGDTAPAIRKASIPNPNHFSNDDTRTGGAVVVTISVDVASVVPGVRFGGAKVQSVNRGSPEQDRVIVEFHGAGLGRMTTV